jgi:hypothetical protein
MREREMKKKKMTFGPPDALELLWSIISICYYFSVKHKKNQLNLPPPCKTV